MRVQYPAATRVSTCSTRSRQIILSALISKTGRIEDVVDITLGEHEVASSMTKIFLLVVGFGAIFVWWSSGAMPESVASHFGPGGVANGFTSRETYARAMLALVVFVPSLVFFASRFASHLPVAFINLPNKAYWLAPERQRSSLASLGKFGTVMAYSAVLLLCFAHWMVTQANQVQPPRLEVVPLVAALGLLFAVMGVAMVVFLGRFFRVP